MRDSYSRATTSVIRSNGEMLSGVITSRVRRRGLCNNIIPRVTSHERARGVYKIIGRTLRITDYAVGSISTVTMACTPKLVKTLLMNIDCTGNLTCKRSGPLIPIRRVTNRVTTGCVDRPRLGPPCLYLMIDNNRSRVIRILSCAACHIINEAHSSTMKRYFSGITEALNFPCPNKGCVSRVSGRNSEGTCGFPRPGLSNGRCSFDFSNVGATIVGLIRGTSRGKRRVGGTSITTSFRGAISSVLTRGLVTITRRLNCERVTLTNNISTGSNIEDGLGGRYSGENCDLCVPRFGCYNSGTTVVNTRNCRSCVTNGQTSRDLGTITALSLRSVW